MARRLTFKQGMKEIEYFLKKYDGQYQDRKVRGVIDNVLWAVAQKEGPEIANALIGKYQLYRPYYGSHEWFDDGQKHSPVIHLDPKAKTPDDWKIFPGDPRHPETKKKK